MGNQITEPAAPADADSTKKKESKRPKLPLKIRLGKSLDFVGQSLFPIGVGAVLGFYAADRGMRWIPTMLQSIMVLCVVSLALMGLGWWLKGKVVAETPQGIRLRKRVVIGVAIAMAVVLVQVALTWEQGDSPLTNLSEEDFNRAYTIDNQRFLDHDADMENLLARIQTEGFLDKEGDRVLSLEEEKLLRDSWASIHRLSRAQDEIRIFYENYWRFDISRVERTYHIKSFLLTFAAELSLYEKAVRFTRMVLRNPSAVKFLDAPHSAHNLPANTFSLFRQQLLGTRDQARVIAGEQYMKVGLAKLFGARAEAHASGVGPLWQRVERQLRHVHTLGTLSRTSLTLKADTQVFKRSVRRLWLPAQKDVAEIAGDTRVRRIGWYLIDETLQQEMDKMLEPGDVMLSRKNWYLSNVGLPGFWPHAILYIGDPDKFIAYFDTEEVKAWVKAESGKEMSLSDYLESRWPGHWRHYAHGEHGEPFRVIEAISEGVVFNTLGHSSGDYQVALRPRLSKLAKAQAIVESFGHLDKPYDFNFDFATDHTLVCTELVWRAYRPKQGKDGLEIPLLSVAARRTLPANELARVYTAQRGEEGRIFDFVFFIDAVEKERKAFFSSEEAFSTTCERPQWDTAQR